VTVSKDIKDVLIHWWLCWLHLSRWTLIKDKASSTSYLDIGSNGRLRTQL